MVKFKQHVSFGAATGVLVGGLFSGCFAAYATLPGFSEFASDIAYLAHGLVNVAGFAPDFSGPGIPAYTLGYLFATAGETGLIVVAAGVGAVGGAVAGSITGTVTGTVHSLVEIVQNAFREPKPQTNQTKVSQDIPLRMLTGKYE